MVHNQLFLGSFKTEHLMNGINHLLAFPFISLIFLLIALTFFAASIFFMKKWDKTTHYPHWASTKKILPSPGCGCLFVVIDELEGLTLAHFQEIKEGKKIKKRWTEKESGIRLHNVSYWIYIPAFLNFSTP